MENTIFSLIPPLLAIFMVLWTKRVLLSLIVGIVAGAILLANFQIWETILITWEAFIGVFIADGAINTWNVYILLFPLMLGVITAFMSMMGGTRAFGEWMVTRVKTRAGVQIMTMILGVIIFIDDYFNSLAVGQVARPIADRHRVSRAKLAYIVDSTAAPVCVVSPVSSWGAYIIGLLGTILAAEGVTEYNAFGAFIQMIPMNLYVFAALGVVLVIALKGVDFGPMKVHENRARETGEVLNPEHKEQIDTESKLPVSHRGTVKDLLLPIVVLFLATVGAMMWTGLKAIDGETTLINIFGSADVSLSLVYGGLAGLIMTFILYFAQVSKTGKLDTNQVVIGLKEGIKSMLPSVYILILAWTIVTLIGQLGTGTYLAGIVEQTNLSVGLLPAILFLIAGFMAFSTGTSWGSFGILLPIAGQIASATDISLILPMMAAVLAGSVFGDHCSPISDTTILSSTGSSCHHIDHVVTQIPYALVAAVISALGYIILGTTNSTVLGFAFVLASLLAFYFLLKNNVAVEVEEDVAN
ncbi:Na+/H+ antiporter NhaC family protein [Terrihalobacillus insolitus]|uniref:Na+/H+ antiporter NhaC family protein n=1 Tax=Terrihalobacillus insolitus TaxID=2950438 RepID=UPI0023403B5A|nr:Na+/H+ antiporter NhaC family protein [Terrihalobacillus insolitus]MDC3412120.1 Na+/H+ antiporter NhaC family protein [Terrihalobacillus insolitus]